VLIDGRKLAELMIDFGIGVTTLTTYYMRRVESDYFDEA
jgi:restriction system protein